MLLLLLGNVAAADLPEKTRKLRVIVLDIDVLQFGNAAQNFVDAYGIEVEWLEFPYGELWTQITTTISRGHR